MEDLRQYERTRVYFADDTHPFTWQILNDYHRRSLIWRMRCGSLPTGDMVEQEFGGDTGFHGYCMCSTADNLQVETIEHMLLGCHLYSEIRRRVRGKRFAKPIVPLPNSLKAALGWIPENEFPPDGKLAKRKRRAFKAIETAVTIWHERNAIRERTGVI